jgi:hypothetical protein
MSIINKTYFDVDPLQLPKGVDSNRDSLIAVYEPEIIIELLGYELGKEVIAYDFNTSPQRIKDLVEGKEYTVSYNGRDQLIKWNGLQNTEKKSLIAYYCGYWYYRNNATQTGNVGELLPNQQNSIIASSIQKQSTCWNLMVDLYGYCGQPIIKPSAYNFLTEFESVYPEWVFTEKGKPQDMNVFRL